MNRCIEGNLCVRLENYQEYDVSSVCYIESYETIFLISQKFLNVSD